MDLDNRKNESKSDLKQLDMQIEVCGVASLPVRCAHSVRE